MSIALGSCFNVSIIALTLSFLPSFGGFGNSFSVWKCLTVLPRAREWFLNPSVLFASGKPPLLLL